MSKFMYAQGGKRDRPNDNCSIPYIWVDLLINMGIREECTYIEKILMRTKDEKSGKIQIFNG